MGQNRQTIRVRLYARKYTCLKKYTAAGSCSSDLYESGYILDEITIYIIFH